jgi:hypothetical protein
MTEEEIQVVVNTLASNPMIGDLIVGTGFASFEWLGGARVKAAVSEWSRSIRTSPFPCF